MLLINRCYSETTPESADDGDFSDAGFITENEEVTFRELVQLLKTHPDSSSMPARGDVGEWYGTGFSVSDYGTMTEREETIHYSRDNPPQLAKYWRKAACAAGIVR